MRWIMCRRWNGWCVVAPSGDELLVESNIFSNHDYNDEHRQINKERRHATIYETAGDSSNTINALPNRILVGYKGNYFMHSSNSGTIPFVK
mmetsp:Transcript_28125/g.34340  ORF Transcript_28125/g.34340 Transcript_28125/m.34340 type:complete len:91 (+) Transcript_28125:238-510(+)